MEDDGIDVSSVRIDTNCGYGGVKKVCESLLINTTLTFLDMRGICDGKRERVAEMIGFNQEIILVMNIHRCCLKH